MHYFLTGECVALLPKWRERETMSDGWPGHYDKNTLMNKDYPNCQAYRCGDQMLCVCGLQWDINDSDRPPCRDKNISPGKVVGRAAVDNIREMLTK